MNIKKNHGESPFLPSKLKHHVPQFLESTKFPAARSAPSDGPSDAAVGCGAPRCWCRWTSLRGLRWKDMEILNLIWIL